MRALVFLLIAAPLAAQQMPKPAATRFETFARSVDSASKVAESMQMAQADRDRASHEASRILFLSTMMSSWQRRPSVLGAVSAIGVSQLFGSFKGNGQMMEFAGLTGGASWLLANLVPHGTLHFRNVNIARR